MITVDRSDIHLELIPDSDADTSYLEQEGFEDRLAEYRRGDFGYVGVRASIELEIPTKQGGYITQKISSPGLWGIEDDSGDDYLRSVFAEETAVLIDMLEAIGVTVED